MRDNGCSGCKYEHLKGSEKTMFVIVQYAYG